MDLLGIDDLLSPEERDVRDLVRRFCDDHVTPYVGEWFDRGEVPDARGLSRELGKLGLLGMHLEGYGCAGTTTTAYGLACLEVEAGDSGIRSLMSVQGSLAMFAILFLGASLLAASLSGPVTAFNYVMDASGTWWGIQDAAPPRVDTGSIRATQIAPGIMPDGFTTQPYSTAINGLSGNGSGTCGAVAGVTVISDVTDNCQSDGSHFTLKTWTGRSMFFRTRLPRSSKMAFTRPVTASWTVRDIKTPPAGASASRRAAMFTPSP